MGCCGDKVIDNEIIKEVAKSVCQIRSKDITGSIPGFFIKLKFNNKDLFRFLVACFNFYSEKLENQDIELETNKKKKLQLSLDSNNRVIVDIFDISIIQIKDEDKFIIKNFNFLTCDENYKYGYDQYKNQDVFTLEYLKGLSPSLGEIKEIQEIDKKCEFNHNIQNSQVSSGSPIFLLSNSRIIGVQKNIIRSEKKCKDLYKGIFLEK